MVPRNSGGSLRFTQDKVKRHPRSPRLLKSLRPDFSLCINLQHFVSIVIERDSGALFEVTRECFSCLNYEREP